MRKLLCLACWKIACGDGGEAGGVAVGYCCLHEGGGGGDGADLV